MKNNHSRFEAIRARVIRAPENKRCAVVCPDEKTVSAVMEAHGMGLVDAVFFIDTSRPELVADVQDALKQADVILCGSDEEAARQAVMAVHGGALDILLKGNLESSVFLKQIVNKEYGLTTDRLITHVAFLDIPSYHKLIAATDGGVVTYPDFAQKRAILENAVWAMHAMGVEIPKVACLAAVEKVHRKMPETVDAAELKAMNQRGEITGCIVEGPISLDLALVKESAVIKEYESPVAGDADILVTPDFASCNLMAKAMQYTGGASFAGVLVGASAPVILTSRTAARDEKINSLACSAWISSGMAARSER